MPVSSYILECLVILALKKHINVISIKNPGVDIKQWTNCRVGMLGWALLSLNFAIVSNQVGELFRKEMGGVLIDLLVRLL